MTLLHFHKNDIDQWIVVPKAATFKLIRLYLEAHCITA